MSSTRKTPEHLKSAKNLRGVAEAVAAEAVGAAVASEAAEVAEVVEAVEAAEVVEAALAAEVADARSTLVQSVLRPETGLACLALISPGGQPNRARRP